MKKLVLTLIVLSSISFNAFSQTEEKLVSKKTHFKIYSHTATEDIEANNYKAVSTLNTVSGDVVFSVPMQSYEFEKSLMQKHYNGKKFLDTKQFPKSKFKGSITNLSEVDFKTDGVYKVTIEGALSMHGKTNNISEKGSITVKGTSIVLNTKIAVTLSDFDVAFKDGKPSTNIAKDIEVTVVAEY